MKLPRHPFLLPFLFLSITGAANWDTGLDADIGGDTPVPTLDPLVSNSYPYFSRGTVPILRGIARSKDASRKHSGRLDYRQSQCDNPTYVLACPITERLPCCPPDFPVCCHDPSDKCCATGYFCAGLETCCPNSSTACGEGCCEAGTTCCNGQYCCNTASGFTCRAGQCVNPTLSSLSTQSTASVASVASVQSVQSISSELSGQTRADGSNVNTINTVSVSPKDPRIEYSPPLNWIDVTSNSGVGSCTNGTKATNKPNSLFKFTFSGSAIALSIIPAANGGPFTVQIDGETPRNLDSKPTSGSGFSGTQCLPSEIFTRDSMEDKPHQIIVKNGAAVAGATNAGSLEFNGIVYTGKGAFGTGTNAPQGENKVSPAVIGGSVGGVLGAIVLVGVGVLFWLRRRKRASENGGTAPVSPNQPMVHQHQPGGPYSPASQPLGSPQHPPSAYGGMALGPQQQQPYIPGPPQQQQPYAPGSPQQSTWGGSQQYQQYPISPQQPQYTLPSWNPQQQPYTDYNRPVSGTSPPGMAPLPMWVQRASGLGPGDGMSVTTAEHSVHPGASQYS